MEDDRRAICSLRGMAVSAYSGLSIWGGIVLIGDYSVCVRIITSEQASREL